MRISTEEEMKRFEKFNDELSKLGKLDPLKEALRRFHTVDIRVAEAGAGTLA